MAIFTALVGGAFIDMFGTRRMLVIFCLATGVFSALRGIAVDFWTLFFFSLLYGMVQPILPMGFVKLNREWFASRQLGFAAGVMSAGFATGLMLGSRISATVLSPLLGGWRPVLIVLGASGIGLALLWALVHPPDETASSQTDRPAPDPAKSALRVALPRAMGDRAGGLWRPGSDARLGRLRADLLARDRLGRSRSRQRHYGILLLQFDQRCADLASIGPLGQSAHCDGFRHIMMTIGTLLMFLVGDHFWGVMLAMALAGFTFDSFMALKGASMTEIDGLQIAFVGSALGFGGVLQNIGSTITPPLGNSLTAIALNTPFLLWAASGCSPR